jgi:hypothetical protein
MLQWIVVLHRAIPNEQEKSAFWQPTPGPIYLVSVMLFPGTGQGFLIIASEIAQTDRS